MFGKLFFILTLLTTTLSQYTCAQPLNPKTIQLNSTNVISIQGPIDDAAANRFIYDLNKDTGRGQKYVYLDTNGGSVTAGAKIINEIQKYNMDCIAHKAYSMGFVILQACKTRYITPYASVMQHQISYGIMNEKEKVESYVNFVDQMEEHLVKLQTNKIGISSDNFRRKTFNDWWLMGTNIINNNVADKIINIKCSTKLTNSNYTITQGPNILVYSKCPLVTDPIDIKKNPNHQNNPFVVWI
jgi:ATP-dependent protease ClpP protease subunit